MAKAIDKVKASIKRQWNDCQLLKLFEFELKDDEYLCVELARLDHGISFSFVEEYETHFSGGVLQLMDGCYLMPYDEYFDTLDYYLEEIHNEMTEGYLIPNDMI